MTINLRILCSAVEQKTEEEKEENKLKISFGSSCKRQAKSLLSTLNSNKMRFISQLWFFCENKEKKNSVSQEKIISILLVKKIFDIILFLFQENQRILNEMQRTFWFLLENC